MKEYNQTRSKHQNKQCGYFSFGCTNDNSNCLDISSWKLLYSALLCFSGMVNILETLKLLLNFLSDVKGNIKVIKMEMIIPKTWLFLIYAITLENLVNTFLQRKWANGDYLFTFYLFIFLHIYLTSLLLLLYISA